MFRATRLRLHTCKIVLLTSLVWFVMDVVVIMYYNSDCAEGGSGWGCAREGRVQEKGGLAAPLALGVKDSEAEAEMPLDLAVSSASPSPKSLFTTTGGESLISRATFRSDFDSGIVLIFCDGRDYKQHSPPPL